MPVLQIAMDDFRCIWLAVVVSVFALAAILFLVISVKQRLRKAKVYIGERTNPRAAQKLRAIDKKSSLGSKMNSAMEAVFGK